MPGLGDPRTCVLVAAAGGGWEPAALRALEGAGMVVLKRCVDLADLLGTATAGQAQAAVVAANTPGLDAEAVQLLEDAGVRTLCVAAEAAPSLRERVQRLGLPVVDDVDQLPLRIDQLAEPEPGSGPAESAPERHQRDRSGRRIAVWGPAGAPGRTLVACSLAAARAARGASTVLLDADPYGGTLAQHLGILDEVSGLLTASRLANDGSLDAGSVQRCRRVAAQGLEVITGLPRPDRWREVREGVVTALVGLSADGSDVVVDCGFSLEELSGTRPARNTMTVEALSAADEVVVVGSGEPAGLTRLARGLLDLAELLPGTPARVVVNRMRPQLGWREREIVGMIEGYAGTLPVHFLPEEREVVDRAQVLGRSVVELGESALVTALCPVVDAVFGRVDTAEDGAALRHRRDRRLRRRRRGTQSSRG